MATTDGDQHSEPDSELHDLRQKVRNLEEELRAYKSQIHALQQEQSHTKSCNENLRKQVKDLTEKVQEGDKEETGTVDIGVQTDVCISPHYKDYFQNGALDFHNHSNCDQNGRNEVSVLKIHGGCGKVQTVIEASTPFQTQAQTISYTEQTQKENHHYSEQAHIGSHQYKEQPQTGSQAYMEQAQTGIHQYTEQAQTDSHQYTEQDQASSSQFTEQIEAGNHQYTENVQVDGYQYIEYPDKSTHLDGYGDHYTKNAEDLENTSLADSLRATAEAAMSQTGFTYDESSGMYYDYSTGYYYDSANQLYYDPNTGIYYYYDTESGLYQFHSQVDLLSYCATETKKKVKKKRKGVAKFASMKEKDTEAGVPKASNICRCCDPEQSETLSEEPGNKRKKTIVDVSEQDSLNEHNLNDEAIHNENVEGKLAKKQEAEFGSEPEEGEITASDKSGYSTDEMTEESSEDQDESEKEDAQLWPPCIRVMVVRSPVLEPGTLFIITAVKSATIGREKDMGHTIQIAEIGVSKFHAEVYFDQDLQEYMLVDQGSQNGTVINGNRILMPKHKCDPHRLEHGDEVKFGETVLSFHIHSGTDTCNGCEPGQVKAHLRLNKKEELTAIPVLSKQDKDKLRRQELKQIQIKYGLQNSAYEGCETLKNSMYKDRAANRRQLVGSDGIYKRDDAPASVNVEICDSNKGRKMLEKMGWKKGEGLGKESCGIKEPIQVQLHQSQAGLGATESLFIEDVQLFRSNKQKNWAKARNRFSETFQQTTNRKATPKTLWVKDTERE
ncbi:angiogenic factor with G patch and FHA domains 1 [Hemiscyllium ocellatum]|uniref:angiogenic factor with G patch and FHA domains 1 n=1 Tax=Hemiscyllium ocellatum TaxID=170820 RepID=UPI0029671012|nr:angiogenic factor with G patch and FHA domains 1 [Hemiscyllium ocellatum]